MEQLLGNMHILVFSFDSISKLQTIDYDFNIHTKDKIDYEHLNLDKINFKSNKEQI